MHFENGKVGGGDGGREEEVKKKENKNTESLKKSYGVFTH